jgi:hypothetical protein
MGNPSLKGGNKFKPERSISETHRTRMGLTSIDYTNRSIVEMGL